MKSTSRGITLAVIKGQKVIDPPGLQIIKNYAQLEG